MSHGHLDYSNFSLLLSQTGPGFVYGEAVSICVFPNSGKSLKAYNIISRYLEISVHLRRQFCLLQDNSNVY